MTVEQNVSDRLTELIELGKRVLQTRRGLGPTVSGPDQVDQQLALQWSTSVRSLLANVFGSDSEHYQAFKDQVGKQPSYWSIHKGFGVLLAAQEDLNRGYLFSIRRLVEAEVFDDFLEQSEHLLACGYYQAAAVLAVGVLEDGLRSLCERKGLQTADPPKVDRMNSELAKAGAYDKLVQKRITALADIRNKAAHGQWDDFHQRDVEEMLAAVRRLMEEHVA